LFTLSLMHTSFYKYATAKRPLPNWPCCCQDVVQVFDTTSKSTLPASRYYHPKTLSRQQCRPRISNQKKLTPTPKDPLLPMRPWSPKGTLPSTIPDVRSVALRNQSEVGVEILLGIDRVKQHLSVAEVISSAPGRIP
jgi:hypothetical protein